MFASWRGVRVWIYFIIMSSPPTYLTLRYLVGLYDADELKPFSIARELVSKHLGIIQGVRLYKAYYNPGKQVAVLEYLVGSRAWRSLSKIHRWEQPCRSVREYYLHEQNEDK